MHGDKLRFRFRKEGDLRLISHHDLMRCLERMLRRAAIPFKSTAGFHPTPRMVVALSLPLGVVGLQEVLELELSRPVDPEHVRLLLNDLAPIGLQFTHVSVIPMKATAIPRRVEYVLPLPPPRVSDAALRCQQLLAQDKIWVDRHRPTPKRLNIRPYLRSLTVSPVAGRFSGPAECSLTSHELTLDVWVTGTGTARIEELLRILAVSDLVDDGAIVTRRRLEIRDEHGANDPADQPPDGPAESEPLTLAEPTLEGSDMRQAGLGLWTEPAVE